MVYCTINATRSKTRVTSFESLEYMEELLYRPPPSTVNATMFFNEFPILLERFVGASGNHLLMGDFNLHVDDRTDRLASRFLDLLDSHNLIPHVSGLLIRIITRLI